MCEKSVFTCKTTESIFLLNSSEKKFQLNLLKLNTVEQIMDRFR